MPNNKLKLKSEFKNPWFWIYFFSLIILVTVFNLFQRYKTINVGSIFLLSFAQLAYGYFQIKAVYNKTTFQKVIGLGYGILLLIFAFINFGPKGSRN